MTALIYVLEDDVDIAKIIQRILLQDGYQVEEFNRRSRFLDRFKQQKPDLCLIDLSLPDGDGLSLITELLRVNGVPSIVVSGRGNLTDRIIGLEVGADDYVVKPFEPRELAARVRAVLRRVNFEPDDTKSSEKFIATFAGWEVNFSDFTLQEPNGSIHQLSAAETRLLQVFVKSTGHVLSRSKLMDHLRLNDDDPLDRSVDARISRLRKKLNDDPKSPQLIRTVYGAGYVFSAKVVWS